MRVKKFNTIFGYGYYILGAGKALFFMLTVIGALTNMGIALNGGNVNSEYYPGVTLLFGFLEIVLSISAVIMIFVNMSKEPSISGGYAIGIGGVLLEFILSGFLLYFALFFQCGLFIKAGKMIIDNNEKLPDSYKPKQKYKVGNANSTNITQEEPLNNTDWFYMDSRTDNKEEIRAKRFKEELEEWKKLLDSGDIDQETYDIETNKLIQKEQKRLRDKNSRLWS